MAKRSILQLVQQLGEGIGSDEIDTLNETIEASEIATILEQVVSEVLGRKRWEFTSDRVRQLDARAGGSTQLNTLSIPSDVIKINCLRYRDTNNLNVTSFLDVMYMQPCEFITHVQARDSADANITAIANEDGVLINVLTDNAPTRWTSFDEENITFDAYDASLGTGNLIADSVIIADIIPAIDFTDPDATLKIPERMETLIFNEALVTCNYRLRQTADPRADRVARRQHIALKEHAAITNNDFKEANHGRRTRSGR